MAGSSFGVTLVTSVGPLVEPTSILDKFQTLSTISASAPTFEYGVVRSGVQPLSMLPPKVRSLLVGLYYASFSSMGNDTNYRF